MNSGSIIFHKTLLWGIVKKVEGDFYTIYFESFGERVISKDFIELDAKMIIELPDSFIKKINNEDFRNYKLQTIERGEKYYEEKRVERFYIKNGHFYAKVSGTTNYDVEIKFKDEFVCTCPVIFECKHSVAVVYAIKDIITKLKIIVNSSIEPKKETIKPIENKNNITNNLLFNKYFEFNNEDYVGNYPIYKFKEFKDDLINLSSIDKKSFLIELNSLNDKTIQTNYINFFILCSNLNIFTDILMDNKDNNKHLYNIYNITRAKIVNGVNYPLNNIDRENILFKDFINENYATLVVNYFFYYCTTDHLINYLKIALIYVGDTELNNIYNSLKIRSLTDINNCKLIMNKLNEENLISLCKAHNELLFEDDRISKISNDQALTLLKNINCKEVDDYLLKNYSRFLDNSKELAFLINKRYQLANQTKKKKYSKILFYLPHSTYLKDVIGDGYLYNEDDLDDEPLNDKLTSKPIYNNINTDDLFYYFDFNYYVFEGNDKTIIQVFLSFNGCKIATAYKWENGATYESVRALNESFIGHFILDYAFDNYKEEIESKYNEIDKVVKKRNFEKACLELNNAIEDFSASMKEVDVSTSRGEKAKLELYFYNDDFKNMELKVGITQMYKVKSLNEFVDMFLRNNTKKYGKNLIFTHNVNNLEEPYNKLISYFIEIYYKMETTYYASNYGISFNNTNVNKMINILNKTYIYIDNNLVLINLERKPVKYLIDNNYNIKFLIDYSFRLVFVGKTIYIVNCNTNEINLADVSEKEIPLLNFFYINNNKSIEPMKEKFRDIIYSRFQDKIEIAPNIKNDFKINDVEINAYFDWHNNKITVRNDFKKDGNIVLADSLIQGGDLSKVNTYNEYLNSLGFVDGVMEDEDNQLEFFKMDFSYLRSLANVYLSDSINNKSVSNMKTPIVRIQYDNSMLDAFLVDSEYSEEELKNIFKALKRKRKFVLLGDDKIVDLDNPESKEFYQTIKDLRIDEEKPLDRFTLPIYQALKAYAHSNNCEIDDFLTNMVNEISKYNEANIELPDVNAKLRDYQVLGYKWLSILKKYHVGGILADDMGLGKTLQIITLIKADNELKPSLIVCPKSLIFNWKTEFNKFASDIAVKEIYGNQNERRDIINQINENEKVIYIISYDSLGRDIEFINHNFNFLILDEAQAIKNVHAKKAINVKSVKAVYRFALTGTPIENNVVDLWSIFDFLMPQYFEELSVFKSRYLHDPEYTNSIAKKVAPFILRRTKKDVLKDLPPKFERIVTCEMDNEQRKLYDAICNEAKDRLALGGKAFDVLPLLTRLRQICIDPNMFLDNYNGESAKMSLLDDIINEYLANNHRILIFSQYVKALEIIEKYLISNNVKYYKITGDTDAKDRLRMASEFNNSNNIPIFLISLKAGGTGLNLIGADTVIHVDPWWNSSAEDQATDRAHRIGQTKNVEVIKLICENSIEQRVLELQNIKKDIIDRLISSNDDSIKSISIDDLQFILN